MEINYALMIFFYWLFLSGVVFIVGSFTSRLFITGPSGADFCYIQGKKKCLGESAAMAVFLVTAFTLVANVVHFFFHCSVMTETPMSEVFSILPAFATKTKYGRFAIARTALMVVILAISVLGMRKKAGWVYPFGAAFSVTLIATISMSGHAGAKGYLNVPFVLDVIHFASITLWIGGLFFIRLCFSFFLKDAGREQLVTCKAMVRKLSKLATYCVYMAVATGAALAYTNVKGFDILLGTPYGIVLIAKVALAAIILGLGALNKFIYVPLLTSSAEAEWSEVVRHRRRLFNIVSFEVFIGTAIMLATALLTHLAPEG